MFKKNIIQHFFSSSEQEYKMYILGYAWRYTAGLNWDQVQQLGFRVSEVLKACNMQWPKHSV